jgi:hypothetical protein
MKYIVFWLTVKLKRETNLVYELLAAVNNHVVTTCRLVGRNQRLEKFLPQLFLDTVVSCKTVNSGRWVQMFHKNMFQNF